MGSALASSGSSLEPAGIGTIGHAGSFWQLLAEATPVAPGYQNLARQTQHRNCNILRASWDRAVFQAQHTAKKLMYFL